MDFKRKCLENSAKKVLFKVRNSIIAVIMRYEVSAMLLMCVTIRTSWDLFLFTTDQSVAS